MNTPDPMDELWGVYRRERRLDPWARTRLAARLASPAPRRRWGLAAIGTFAVLSVVAAVVWTRRAAEPVRTEVAAVSLPLDHVGLRLDGEGTVGGTQQAPVIDWRDGTLSVSVTPHQGVALTVVTAEAEVHVVGTVFDVHREHHATRVSVAEGTVRVRCAGRDEAFVHGGDTVECLPGDPADLLLRVASLTRAGGAAEARLDTIDRALAAAPAGPVADELHAHRAKALADAGRVDEALAEAERYLAAADAPRRGELASFVVRTAFERDGCGARPALERWAEAASGPEGLLLAGCLVDEDPARAQALARAYLARGAPAEGDPWAEVARRIVGTPQ